MESVIHALAFPYSQSLLGLGAKKWKLLGLSFGFAVDKAEDP